MEGFKDALKGLFTILPVLLLFAILGLYKFYEIIMWLIHHIKIS